jgi:hypothetical protein
MSRMAGSTTEDHPTVVRRRKQIMLDVVSPG